MPCNCDYLEPNDTEIESKRAAELLVYVLTKNKMTVENWIKEASNDIYGNSKKLNWLVVNLCKICSEMSERDKKEIVYNAKCKMSRRLADWYEEHLEADKQRIKEESSENKTKRLKKIALSKLTKSEIAALGLE